MQEEIKNDLEIYLSCSPERLKEMKETLLVYSRKQLLEVLYLPKDSEPRFRVYDLCLCLGKDGEKLLQNVFDECSNDSDPLSQLAAIEFVHEHKMVSTELFIKLFKEHISDPLLLPTIAEATVPMLLTKPEENKELLEYVIKHATTDIPDLLGTLPDIARSEFGAGLLVSTKEFMEWAAETQQHSVELRTMNYYIRTLMIKRLKDPKPVILDPRDIIRSLANPSPGLRVACLEHVAAAAPFAMDSFLNYQGFVSTMCDVTMDTTIDEEKSRLKAQDALGISIRAAGKNAPSELRKEAEPELMVI